MNLLTLLDLKPSTKIYLKTIKKKKKIMYERKSYKAIAKQVLPINVFN